MNMLGRSIIKLNTPKEEVFPTIMFEGEEKKIKVDWMEHEVPNFVIVS